MSINDVHEEMMANLSAAMDMGNFLNVFNTLIGVIRDQQDKITDLNAKSEAMAALIEENAKKEPAAIEAPPVAAASNELVESLVEKIDALENKLNDTLQELHGFGEDKSILDREDSSADFMSMSNSFKEPSAPRSARFIDSVPSIDEADGAEDGSTEAASRASKAASADLLVDGYSVAFWGYSYVVVNLAKCGLALSHNPGEELSLDETTGDAALHLAKSCDEEIGLELRDLQRRYSQVNFSRLFADASVCQYIRYRSGGFALPKNNPYGNDGLLKAEERLFLHTRHHNIVHDINSSCCAFLYVLGTTVKPQLSTGMAENVRVNADFFSLLRDLAIYNSRIEDKQDANVGDFQFVGTEDPSRTYSLPEGCLLVKLADLQNRMLKTIDGQVRLPDSDLNLVYKTIISAKLNLVDLQHARNALVVAFGMYRAGLKSLQRHMLFCASVLEVYNKVYRAVSSGKRASGISVPSSTTTKAYFEIFRKMRGQALHEKEFGSALSFNGKTHLLPFRYTCGEDTMNMMGLWFRDVTLLVDDLITVTTAVYDEFLQKLVDNVDLSGLLNDCAEHPRTTEFVVDFNTGDRVSSIGQIVPSSTSLMEQEVTDEDENGMFNIFNI